MTTKIHYLLPSLFAASAFVVVACAKAPSARKTAPVPIPALATNADNDDVSAPPPLKTPVLKLFSKLEVDKSTGKLYRCIEFKTPPESEAEEKQLRSRGTDTPESVEFSSPEAACPADDIKAVCLTEIQGVTGAYVKENHGLSVDTPAKIADLKLSCESKKGKWSETTATTGDPGTAEAEPKTEMPALPAASPTAPAQANPAQPATPATEKVITSTYKTFITGVGAQAVVLCQIAAGAKITIKGTPTISAAGLGQVDADIAKTDACLLEKATFLKVEWSGW